MFVSGERIGVTIVVSKNNDVKDSVQGNLDTLIRGMFLTVASPANRILSKMWSTDELKNQW